MSILHNRIFNKQLKTRMISEKKIRITVSFYRYFTINNPKIFRDHLYIQLNNLKIFGRIYIAKEGINGQLSVLKENFSIFKKTLFYFHPKLYKIRLNVALEDNGKSFWVLRLKVRNQILSDGINDINFDPKNVGEYLQANAVNQIIDDPNTLFVDMRNHYEYEIGRFKNAITAHSDTFREQLPKTVKMLKHSKDKNIVMYCTGGIRCEKATAYMRHYGFKNIYHIEGGIIQYVREAKRQNLPLKFIGKNFVFDERMGERVTNDVIACCHQCGILFDIHSNCRNQNCHVLFIQCQNCTIKFTGCCSKKCQEELKILHKNKTTKTKSSKIIKKCNTSKTLLKIKYS
ncbi:hypothetical protein F7X37_00272 [Candidatus Ecksteinia adelgidicola]|nr:hypothetical protein F7X37_00272 [Candidatus Ecksteinia adelgidicola]